MKKAPTSDTDEPPYADAPWVQTTNRLLGAEMRPDPRPKAGKPARLKYWKQADLVAATGLRANTISDMLLGKRLPGIDTLEAIGKVFQMPAFMFLMPVDEAERYAQFRVAVQVEDTATQQRKLAREIAADLAPAFADLIERRMAGKTEEPVSAPAIVPAKKKKRA